MAINRKPDRTGFELSCDFCSEAVEYEGNFDQCLQQAKEDEWRTMRVGKGYEHACPTCAEDMRSGQITKTVR